MSAGAVRVDADRLDARALWILALLLLAVIALNVDRFALGADGPQRAHDLGDFNITNFMGCGQFWAGAGRDGWDASTLRGWPSGVGTYAPQHLGCVVAGTLPPWLIMPVLQVLILALMTTGTYLFASVVLGLTAEAALGTVFLQVASFYWFHEHDLVTSATLLPAAVGYLGLRGGWAINVLRVVALLLLIALLDPPTTLILMPLAHLALCLTLPLRNRRDQLVRWCLFWMAYGVYYAPTLVDYLGQFQLSSRALFHAPPHSSTALQLIGDYLYSVNVISPALAVLALTSRRSYGLALAGLAAALLIVVSVAANRYWIVESASVRWPLLLAVSTTYYRMFYVVPIVVVVMGAFLLDRALGESRWSHLAVQVGVCLVLCAVALLLRRHDGQTYGYLPRYVALVGTALVAYCAIGRRRFLAAGAMLLLAMWPLRTWYTRLFESPHQGNLFIERSWVSPDVQPFRVETLMRTCDASDIFPAQAAAVGQETLGGISNYYSRGFAESWQTFVADRTGACTDRFRYWNSRAELPIDGWNRDRDTVLAWLWFNNVALVRSVEPLEHPRLELVDREVFPLRWFGDVVRYRYRLRDPLSRVFAGRREFLERLTTSSADDQISLLREAAAQQVFRAVPLRAYRPSDFEFRGAFGADEAVVVSTNFHPDWVLYVDGRRQDAATTSGPLGTLRVAPSPGEHDYELRFEGRRSSTVAAGMFGAGVILALALAVGGVGRRPGAAGAVGAPA